MRLLSQEAKRDRMDLQWAFLGPSSLQAYCLFECDVLEQEVVFSWRIRDVGRHCSLIS